MDVEAGATTDRSGGGPPPLLPVLTLTEEELLVLTDGDLGVVPRRLQLPDTAEGAELVQTVALRALMARGLVVPRPGRRRPHGGRSAERHAGVGSAGHDPGVEGAERDGVAWEAVEPLGLTLTLRALAPAVLGLQRVLGPRADELAADPGEEPESTTAVRYLHLHPEVAVIEDVTPDGMHSLATALPERFTDAIADFVRPPEAVPGTGSVRRLAATGDSAVADLLAALGHPTVLVEAAVLSSPRADDPTGSPSDDPTGSPSGDPTGSPSGDPTGDPLSQMFALGPGGCFRSPDSVTYHPVDPDTAIRELLQATLSGA